MNTAYVTFSEAETSRVARDLVRRLAPRATVLLHGELGAGKTAFVRGLVQGAGGSSEDVSSPTFILVQEYSGVRRVFHVDLFRLNLLEIDDFLPELDHLMSQDGILAIEWADRMREPFSDAVTVVIEDKGADCRKIVIDEANRSSDSEP